MIPGLFATLVVARCHYIVSILCLGIVSLYLHYHFEQFESLDHAIFDVNSAPFYPIMFSLLTIVAEGLKR